MLLLISNSVIFRLLFLACYCLKVITCLIFFWFWNMLTGKVSQLILAPFYVLDVKSYMGTLSYYGGTVQPWF